MQNTKNSLLTSMFTILIGVLVCIGWLANLPTLTSMVPGLPPMKFNTALCFILLGAATYLITAKKYPRLQLAFIIVILSYCAISIIQDIAMFDLGVDEFFVIDTYTHNKGGSRPGRMAQATEMCMIVIGIALLAMRDSTFELAHKTMIHLAALISFVAMIGYLFQVPFFYNYSLFGSMTMPTALLLFMNSINISLLNPHIGLMKYFPAYKFGNGIVFKLFPRLVVAVLILSALELGLHKKELITDEVGSAMFTFSFIAIGFLLIYYSAVELNHIDDKRTEAEVALKKTNENLELTIAERTRTLAESEQLLKSIFDNTDASILVKGLDGKYTMANKTFHQTFQITTQGLTTKTVSDLSPKAMLDRQLSADQEVITKGASLVYEVKAPTMMGERYFRTNKFPIFDGDKNVTGIATVSTDITELKKEKADQELLATFLQVQNKQLINFSHILSHNLRSPVINLKTIIQFYNETNDPIKKVAFFKKITSLVENLSITFEEMMEIMKIREDISKERQLLSFEEVFNKTKAILNGQIEEAEGTITHSFSVSTIHYPKVYLDSIFLNLMSNGIKYRSPQRKAHLHFITRLENNTVILEVIDNGLGLDMGKYGTLLFNLNKTFHNNRDARGVGLYITKTQVEAMGGTIKAESAVDVGTTFKITFKE